jgi:hypothetical protein
MPDCGEPGAGVSADGRIPRSLAYVKTPCEMPRAYWIILS